MKSRSQYELNRITLKGSINQEYIYFIENPENVTFLAGSVIMAEKHDNIDRTFCQIWILAYHSLLFIENITII